MSETCKIFVGNVPFECTQNEFRECFNKMKGYVDAEIIYKNGIYVTRGFGFVTFDKKENANILINNNNVLLKNRNLRFSEYDTDQQQNNTKGNNIIYNMINNKNFIMVKDINYMTRENIYEIFKKYGTVGRHFLLTDNETGNMKNCAIVEILEDNNYESLLQNKYIKINESEKLKLEKWNTHRYICRNKNKNIKNFY